jgi:hypothetical protein
MTPKANYYLLVLCVAIVATLFKLHQIKKHQVQSNPFHGEWTEIKPQLPPPSIEEQRLQQRMHNEINNLWSPIFHPKLYIK